ncbi:hypothetical protein RJT34_02895 [Clitoria ternatea]|uniref:Uncharacterized protein n=1 Tax=Clitoria ternatea TaxID=43366 RepID=A0AAN9KJS9_CLITE
MVEEMYMEEEKEEQGNSKVTPSEDHQNGSPNSTRPDEDQKPKLLRIDSECVSSIVNKKNEEELETTAFGSVELDFSSYTHGGSGVSLTLGLQQHDDDEGSGVRVSLAFPAAATTQSSMFEPVHVHHQYSLLDAQQQQQGQNMPYRNLMGTHLLHHLPS